MKLKILIIGKNSFIGKNIHKNLNKKLDIKKICFDTFKIKKLFFFRQFDFIINCSITKEYIAKKYSLDNDLDFFVANKVKFTKCRYIFISTRNVYGSKFNITEETPTRPITPYGRNKLITEKKLAHIFKDRLLVLRTSNIIGLKSKNKNQMHTTFLDYFCQNIAANKVILHKNIYKDFLSIDQFTNILFLLIQKKAFGIINVSMGKKVYLKNIVKWLNFFNKKDYKYIHEDKGMNLDSFTLNNKKLNKIINYKILLIDLKKDCLKISKKIFLKK